MFSLKCKAVFNTKLQQWNSPNSTYILMLASMACSHWCWISPQSLRHSAVFLILPAGILSWGESRTASLYQSVSFQSLAVCSKLRRWEEVSSLSLLAQVLSRTQNVPVHTQCLTNSNLSLRRKNEFVHLLYASSSDTGLNLTDDRGFELRFRFSLLIQVE